MFNVQAMIVFGLVSAAMLMVERSSCADLIYYAHGTRDAWFEDAGSIGTVETITFTEHPTGLLTSQYAGSHGLQVSGSNGVFIIEVGIGFPNDGRGIRPNIGDVVLDFDRPMTAIAAEFPGFFYAEIFNDEGLVGDFLMWGPGGPGNFTGITSAIPFTRVRFYDTDGIFGIDDLHFVAQAIPAPGAFAVLLAGVVIGRRRRR